MLRTLSESRPGVLPNGHRIADCEVVRAEGGEPVLIEFGAARVQHRDRTHTQVLTAGYAPVEQYSTGVGQGPPTDIYAPSVVSCRVLTGDVVPSAPEGRGLSFRGSDGIGRPPKRARRGWEQGVPSTTCLPERASTRPARMGALRRTCGGQAVAARDTSGPVGSGGRVGPEQRLAGRLANLSEAPSAALPPGCRIAEYEIVRVLGAGGFGITYLAFDHQLDGPVALKEYFPTDAATRVDGATVEASSASREVFAWGFDRFMAEARAIHRFRHPNVVRAHRYLEANGTAYIVMEYVEGESLKAILDRRGRLPADEWRPWLEALVDGLAHVHGHGYLHRDIKPANIVVRAEDGEPVLIDFGSARVQHRDRTHTQVLTAGYAPIEQYSTGATQGPPADIYALAAVSYRVLTGGAAPSAPDRVLSDDYEPLADRVLDADAGWLAALDRGLAVRPEDRPPDVNAWSTALGTARASETNSSAPGSRWDTVEDGEPTPRRLGLVKRLRGIVGRPLASLRFTLGVFFFVWTENYAVAKAWFRKAADLDHPYGQAWLGWLYVDGAFPFSRNLVGTTRLSEVAKDEAQAAGWFRKAAAQGLADAQVSLATMYAAGVGVQQDYSKAERWCRRAAERGDPWAQNVLGIVHAAGRGPLKDAAEAERWFRRAASPGRMPGRRFLLLRGRRHSGLAIAQFNLGCFYATGQGRRDADAARWLREAAEQGDSDAQNALGVNACGRQGCAARRCRGREVVHQSGGGRSCRRPVQPGRHVRRARRRRRSAEVVSMACRERRSDGAECAGLSVRRRPDVPG